MLFLYKLLKKNIKEEQMKKRSEKTHLLKISPQEKNQPTATKENRGKKNQTKPTKEQKPQKHCKQTNKQVKFPKKSQGKKI